MINGNNNSQIKKVQVINNKKINSIIFVKKILECNLQAINVDTIFYKGQKKSDGIANEQQTHISSGSGFAFGVCAF